MWLEHVSFIWVMVTQKLEIWLDFICWLLTVNCWHIIKCKLIWPQVFDHDQLNSYKYIIKFWCLWPSNFKFKKYHFQVVLFLPFTLTQFTPIVSLSTRKTEIRLSLFILYRHRDIDRCVVSSIAEVRLPRLIVWCPALGDELLFRLL